MSGQGRDTGEDATGDLDDLVPLYRRKAFDRDLAANAAAALASGDPLSLIVLDGDGFKQINDSHGHAAGDDVLRGLGEIIRRRVRGKGRGYRFGGDEFGILLENYSASEAAGFAEDLRESVAKASFGPDGLRLKITLGVASLPIHAEEALELFKKADAALYEAKQAGRNSVSVSGSTARMIPGSGGLATSEGGMEQAGDLALISPPDGRLYFIPVERVEEGDEGRLTLNLLPGDNKQASMLADLPTDRPIGIAYGLSAALVRLETRSKTRAQGLEKWTGTFREHESDYGDSFIHEMSFGGTSADEFATMRARRILLDEFDRRRSSSSGSDLNRTMSEMYVRGFNTPIEVERSPLLDLLPFLEVHPERFLEVARLVAVLSLKLSRAVEHVFTLNLRLEDNVLHVTFEGQRARRWSNAEPAVVRVSGTLDLKKPRPSK